MQNCNRRERSSWFRFMVDCILRRWILSWTSLPVCDVLFWYSVMIDLWMAVHVKCELRSLWFYWKRKCELCLSYVLTCLKSCWNQQYRFLFRLLTYSVLTKTRQHRIQVEVHSSKNKHFADIAYLMNFWLSGRVTWTPVCLPVQNPFFTQI